MALPYKNGSKNRKIFKIMLDISIFILYTIGVAKDSRCRKT